MHPSPSTARPTLSTARARRSAGPLLVACLVLGAAGRASPATADVVAQLLERPYAQDANQRAAQLALLDTLSADDLLRLCEMLREPGDDDTSARLVLHAAALHAACPAGVPLRERYIAALGRFLQQERTAGVCDFLVEQVELLCAGDAAVPLLAAMLRRDETADRAAGALVLLGTDAARRALRESAATSEGRAKLAAVGALVTLRDKSSADLFAAASTNPSADLRNASLDGLAAIGDQRVLPAIERGLADASVAERARATARLLSLARRLIADWQLATADAMLRELGGADRPAHERAARLRELAFALRATAAPDLAAAMASDDLELRAAAVEIAKQLEGAAISYELAQQVARATAPHARAALISVLAHRGDATGLAPTLAALKDEDESVRLTAIAACARLADVSTLQPMLMILEGAGDAELRALEESFTRMTGAGVSAGLAEAQQSAAPALRVRVINALANRRAREQLPVILDAARQTDPSVRVAAIRAVGVLGGDNEVPPLLELLAATTSDAERTALEESLSALCRRSADRSERVAALLSAQAPDDRFEGSLVRVLGRLGGPEAWARVRAALDDKRAELRASALDALAVWPSPDAAPDIIALAQQREDMREHVGLLRAAARLIGDDRGDAARRIGLLSDALRAARRVDEKRLLLSRLGQIADAAAFDALKPSLADAETRAEAAAAVLSVAEALLPAGWPAADAGLQLLASVELPATLRERWVELTRRVDDFQGFVTHWSCAGPFTQAGKSGPDLMDVPFPPERPGQAVSWQPQPRSDDPGEYWLADLNRSFGGPHRAGYLAARVFSPAAQEARLELGSDDGVRAWLNGEVVHTNNALRGLQRGQDKVSVRLNQGWNVLMLKVVNAGGGWAACARLRGADGGRLEGLRFEPGP
ncbi:MAG: HEAT repeat domain-containing protein [Phycisphaerae bacterium]|nr:HEAT repeat domain-containing protein [Phycisphaerae bacterium]MCZ2398900.1 HEAT repeat domain-containing protein [Phycisphaerae bacterium]